MDEKLIQFLLENTDNSESDIQFFLCWDILESMKKDMLDIQQNIISSQEHHFKIEKVFTGFDITNQIMKNQIEDIKKLLSRQNLINHNLILKI